ncbi:LlaJI family restriction endonuclease [Rothia nasimurium]|uniref:LlaJI family restriction endonuclease n=1 Tax=Rothia nasimurium TaxID=85336 RepID=UPI001F41C1E1|nr:LlaJI family restriction endonuclease [Rothia nasimurium]
MNDIYFHEYNPSNQFVGIRIDDGAVHLHFPIGYNLEEDSSDSREDLLHLLKLLARKGVADGSALGESGHSVQAENILNHLFIILVDYIRTGRLITDRFKADSYSTDGLVDWNKTISKFSPVVSGRNIVYVDLISSTTNNSYESLVTLAHEYCVAKSMDILGWLFGENLRIYPREASVSPYLIYAVQKRISSTFNTYELKLLNSILSILKDLPNEGITLKQGLGTSKFEYYWEFMVDIAFGIPESGKRKYFPKALWVLEDRRLTPSSLQPDTVVRHQNDLLILDSKYYKFGFSGLPSHLPGSSDIFKQIVYGDFASCINEVYEGFVYNAFVLPANLSNHHTWFKIVGYSIPQWCSDPSTYQVVVAVLVDTKYLISNYNYFSDEQKSIFTTSIIDYVNETVVI